MGNDRGSFGRSGTQHLEKDEIGNQPEEKKPSEAYRRPGLLEDRAEKKMTSAPACRPLTVSRGPRTRSPRSGTFTLVMTCFSAKATRRINLRGTPIRLLLNPSV